MNRLSSILMPFSVCALAVLPMLSGCQTESTQYGFMTYYRPMETGPFNVLVMPGEDPARSMAVVYHSLDEDSAPMALFDTEPRGGDVEGYANRVSGETRTIPNLPDGRRVHGVMLTDLEPDTTYYFAAGDPETGTSEEFSFRTFPASPPYSLAIGGDMGARPLTATLVAETGKADPDAFIVGGDIAYANGAYRNAKGWDELLGIYGDGLRAPDGRLIPIWAALGNHETNREMSALTEVHALVAPFYMGYFWPQAEGAVFSRRLGDDAVLLFLDSGHLTPHEEQVAWLDEQLAAAADIPFAFAIYHVPLFPAHRDHEGAASVAGRTYWMPLFDQYHLTAGFEHHDHVFKRTHPLVNGVPTEGGTVYLGDGNMGVTPRVAELREHHVRADNTSHFWLLEIGTDTAQAMAINEKGEQFDQVMLSPRL